MMEPEGVTSIVFGAEEYRDEARDLIRALRRASPRLPIAIITDRPWTRRPEPDHTIVCSLDPELEGSVYGWKASLLFLRSPFYRTLYLDPDVYVSSDVRPVLGLLDYYDLGFRHFGPPLMEPDGLTYHSKVHGGVILFRRSQATLEFSQIHLQLFRDAVKAKRAAGLQPVIDDERTLAIALARSTARVTHLGDYLALHVGDLSTLWHPPLIYHGRVPCLPMIHQQIACDWRDPVKDVEKRLWVPRARAFVRPMSARWRSPLLFAYLVGLRWLQRLRLRRRPKGSDPGS